MPATTRETSARDLSNITQPYSESGLPYSITYSFLPDGAEGTFETLRAMAKCVRGEVAPHYYGAQSEELRQLAEAIVYGSMEQADEVKALFLFCRDSIAYRQHPWNQQRVQDAARTILLKTGDCVSKSVLLATLLASLGHLPRFVAQSTGGCEYSHVYVETLMESGTWLALDPVNPAATPGWSQQLPDGGFETTWTIFEE